MRARLSCQGLVRMPKCSAIKEQSSAELAGLFAGVGYSSVVMGATVFILNEPHPLAASKIDELVKSQHWCHCERSEAISFNVST